MDDLERRTPQLAERLKRQRIDLLRRTAAVDRDLRQPHDPDWDERASELENDEVLEQLDEDGRAELARIDAALTRIEEGSYGTCRACGSAIPLARLEALPDAPECVECAERRA